MDTNSSRRNLRGFNGGEPHYRAKRLRAAMACSRFNALSEDCSPQVRADAFRAVISGSYDDPNKSAAPGDTNPPALPASQSQFPSQSAASAAGVATTATSASPVTPPLTPTPAFMLDLDPDPRTAVNRGPPSGLSQPGLSSSSSCSPLSSALQGSGSQPCPDATRVGCAPVPDFPDQLRAPGLDSAHTARARAVDLDSGCSASAARLADLPQSVCNSHENLYPASFGPYVKAPIYVDYGINVRIGSSTFINRNCHILDSPVAELVIGERVLLGPNVHLYNVTHTLNMHDRTDPSYDSSSLAGDIVIGDDCWIGGGAIILPGVTIGTGSVIGAGSVVTRNVPAHHLAVGVPARVIRKLKPDDHRDHGSCPADLACQIKQFLRMDLAMPLVGGDVCGDIWGLRAAKARIKKLELFTALLATTVLWLWCRGNSSSAAAG